MSQSEETLSLLRHARQLHAQGARDRWIKRLDLPRTIAVTA